MPGLCTCYSNFVVLVSCAIALLCISYVLTGCIQSGYCKQCKVNLGPNCSLEEHQRSRTHINKLLQLGIEVPLSCASQSEENQLPEGGIVSVILDDNLSNYTACNL